MSQKVIVDEALCAASGQCYKVAPQVFQEDADGYCAQAGQGLIQLENGMEDAAREGEQACPESAIRVTDEE